MIFNIGNILSIIAFIGFVDCSDETVKSTRCKGSGKKTTCLFNSTSLNLDTTSTIQFVTHNGKKVKCGKKTVRGDNVWYGTCDGDARDANFVRRKDKKGRTNVFGSIHVGSDVCQFSPNADGVDEIICLPITAFPDEHEGIEAPPDDKISERALRNLHVGYNPNVVDNATDTLQALRGNLHNRVLYDDSGATIDVMVVWTKQAECKVSRLSYPCTLTAITESNMRGLIDLAVAETNTAFQLSGILSSLRLVHAYRDPVYVESTKDAFEASLEDLRGTTDGKLDDVHAKRALYGADMVQMLISSDLYCGIAYVNSGRTRAFAIVRTSCATGVYSYGHEIGHNFVMSHDRGTENACKATGYSYGFRSPDASFRSILAYNCKVGQCDKMPKNGCTRVQRFSNSQFLYDGKPMGNALNDNAKQWNSIRALVASHYPAMNCNNNSQCDDNNSRTVDTCNIATAICVFTPTSIVPTRAPTKTPTRAPTIRPTRVPTKRPTRIPTKRPTRVPTKRPTRVPTKRPTRLPTKRPTRAPTKRPTRVPTKAPTRTPTKLPTRAPTKLPIRAPTKAPTRTPTKLPTRAPSNAPTGIPTKSPNALLSKAPTTLSPITNKPTIAPTLTPTSEPTRIPTIAPTKAPLTSTTTKVPSAQPPTKVSTGITSKSPNTMQPTQAPKKAQTLTPTDAPTNAPLTAAPITNKPTTIPTRKPTKIPTKTPTRTPTKTPFVSTPSYYMESKVVTGVSSSGWTIVTLLQRYISPIPVCTIRYDTGTALLPAVVRMQNVKSQSFDIRLQNPSNQTITRRDIHCVIVEEGAYKLPDGRKIEAKKYQSIVTDNEQNWNGQAQTYINRYTIPIVLGQVMTYADSRWSAFYSLSKRQKPPNAKTLRTGKHLGEDNTITRLAETVGYIVIEKGHASYSTGIEMETGRTPEVVVGYVEKQTASKFATPFLTKPEVTVVSQAGMNGEDGSWAVITGNTTSTYLGVAVDEDQTFDSERSHTAEEVDYIAFTSVGSIQLTKSL